MKLESGSLPVAVRASEERLSKGGVYLLETGLHLFLWVGANAQQELLLNIFGTSSFGQIDTTMVRRCRSRPLFSFWVFVSESTLVSLPIGKYKYIFAM